MFELGMLVATTRIADRIREDKEFNHFVFDSLERYKNCDWGDLDDEDKMMNDEALKCGDRLLAAYKTRRKIGKSGSSPRRIAKPRPSFFRRSIEMKRFMREWFWWIPETWKHWGWALAGAILLGGAAFTIFVYWRCFITYVVL